MKTSVSQSTKSETCKRRIQKGQNAWVNVLTCREPSCRRFYQSVPLDVERTFLFFFTVTRLVTISDCQGRSLIIQRRYCASENGHDRSSWASVSSKVEIFVDKKRKLTRQFPIVFIVITFEVNLPENKKILFLNLSLRVLPCIIIVVGAKCLFFL